jgi:hemerythrin-like domain-containing protein
MPISLGARKEHGFDEPLGLLSDCHRRIERFLEILQKVVEQAQGNPLNDEQRRAASAGLEYFRVAAPRHTDDEEDSLFPLLRQSKNPAAQTALAMVEELEHDHKKANAAHDEVDQLYRAWMDSQSLDSQRTARLRQLLNDLREMYRRHIDVEDQQIFPLAGQVLDEKQLAQLGHEMAERRGINTER